MSPLNPTQVCSGWASLIWMARRRAEAKSISSTLSDPGFNRLVTSMRCGMNILSLSSTVSPLSLTVAKVSRPSKARTVTSPSCGAPTVGSLTLYVQVLSATHSALSSLKPRKGSGILCGCCGQSCFNSVSKYPHVMTYFPLAMRSR